MVVLKSLEPPTGYLGAQRTACQRVSAPCVGKQSFAKLIGLGSDGFTSRNMTDERGDPAISPSPSPYGIDSKRLEAYFKVLAYANRIDLLSLLREPHTLEEIRILPGPSQAGQRPQRPISRQAVSYHLEQLIQAGLVRMALAQREGKKPLQEYEVEQANLYALVEEFRRVSTLSGVTSRRPQETVALASERREPWDEGPKLVLVHGVDEGRAFALRPENVKGQRGWIIGRRSGAHVRLNYDPYVSLENSEIVLGPSGHSVLDLRSSRNGTFLNWTRIPVGGEARLRPGDVIGVGRSLLVFRND